MKIKEWISQHVHRDQVYHALRSHTEVYRSKALQSPSSALLSVSSLPPRAIASFLAHCFFKHAETNYFTVERTWLESKLDMAYTNANSITHSDVSTMCVIFGVLAVGTQYAYLESATECISGRKSTQHGQFTGDTVGVMLYQQACLLLPDVITLSSLESVQACLLLGIYTLPLDASGLAWIYLGIGVKLANQNGMHRKSCEDSFDPSIRETRKLVWWTLYTLERRIAIFHGRPFSIARSDVDTELPDAKSDVRSSPDDACILATLQLNDRLCSISHSISLLHTSPTSEVAERLTRLFNLQQDLINWWRTLPNNDIHNDHTSHPENLRRAMHLKLEYCLGIMFAGRYFIFSGPCLEGNSLTSTTKIQNASPSGINSQTRHMSSILVSECVSAAHTVIETCRYLYDTIGLARASYTEFSACRAALLVITTQCLQATDYKQRHALREGLAMLKEMSGEAELARTEVSLIEGFQHIIASMDIAGDDVAGGVASDFSIFKKWENSWKQDSFFAQVPRPDDSMLMASLGLSSGSHGAPSGELPLWTSLFGSDRDVPSCTQGQDNWAAF
ncbi:fungal-specific transcription factor domain-containing protein [Aspergillus novoparasiticus]|uniref:Fungal-specific transcription factor domain-containing protein n=1 Tax=Aspergillus novoparasiticus TaxID=986946 RepID=A0A5N6ED66_9EURO|nr:fungal-specific transcription factor domain-containing protein [Aspergillus novoparasiticus]